MQAAGGTVDSNIDASGSAVRSAQQGQEGLSGEGKGAALVQPLPAGGGRDQGVVAPRPQQMESLGAASLEGQGMMEPAISPGGGAAGLQTVSGVVQQAGGGQGGVAALPGDGLEADSKAKATGGMRPSLDAKGRETIWGCWKRVHREEREERAMVQYAGVKHAMFGVPTPPNSGSEMSNRKTAFVDILQNIMMPKKRGSDGSQEFIINMNSASSESVDFSACKRVCVERVEAVVGIDGIVTHVTKEVDGGEEVNQGKKENL